MSVIYFLIGVGILVAGGFLLAFIWAVKSGQYEDDYTPSVRILFDDLNKETNSQDSTDIPKDAVTPYDENGEMKKSNNNKS